jgi:O-antigen/teichoic acid export membrane protein
MFIAQFIRKSLNSVMKGVSNNLPANVGYERIFKWTKLIAVTTSAQALVQLLGLFSGILIIRLLPTSEYAFYTLANTLLGTMTILADGGISAGVMASGAKVWQDKKKLGAVINTGLMLRRKFAIYSLVISLPILFYLLRHNGAGLILSLLIILSIIPAFYAALSDNLLEIASKLHQDIPRLQKNQMAAGIGRFFMITISLFLFPWTFVAILGNGIPRIWANLQLKKISAEYADNQQQADPVIKKEILSVVRRILPGSIYYCLSGQITIFIISIFGTTNSIAQAGALSRLTMLLSVFAVLNSTLIIPRFARIPNNSKLIFTRYMQIQFILLLFSSFIIGIVYLYPAQTLWILGKNYSNLKVELILNVAVSCINLIAGICFSLNTARGWTINPVISISLNILSIIVGIIFINVATLKGVLILNILVGVVDVLMYLVYTLNKIRQVKLSEIKDYAV